MHVMRWFAVVPLVALTLSACSQKTARADDIMKRVQATRAATKDAHAKLDVSMTGGRQNGHYVLETWMAHTGKTDPTGQPISASRFKVLESSNTDMQGSEIINDGTTMWVFDPKRNQAIRGNLADMQSGGVSPQDPTAQLQRMQGMLQRILDGSNVQIINSAEKISGHDTWKLKLTPKPETVQQMQFTSNLDVTMWVDQKRDIPLKGIVNAAEIGTLEGTVQSIDLDKGVDPAIFQFTPGADTKIVDAAELAKKARPQTTTLDQARTAVSFKILNPQPLPDGVKMDEVQTAAMGGESVIEQFSGAFSFSLVQTKGQGRGFGATDTPFGSKSESVTVRGQQGTLITGTTDQKGTLLRWQEQGVTIVIAGPLTRDEAMLVAARLQ
ncbi:MAG: hypothetical protein NVS4B8_16820 [Herpetosiphon sp.]